MIIVDDHPFVRRMIKETLQRAGAVVIAEAHDGRQAVELTRRHRPDVALMDVVMPGARRHRGHPRHRQGNPEQVVVILTTADDDEIGLLGLRVGAAGFLPKDVDIEVLPRAIRAALTGEAAISRRLGKKLGEQLRRLPEGGGGMRPVKSPLTPREWEVIDLLLEHKTTDQIAELLVLSNETVRSHVKNTLRNSRFARRTRRSPSRSGCVALRRPEQLRGRQRARP